MPRLSLKAFDRAVQKAMERIPSEFLSYIEDVVVLVEDEPSPEVLADLAAPGETLFGAYFGIPLGEKGVLDVPVKPDRNPIEGTSSAQKMRAWSTELNWYGTGSPFASTTPMPFASSAVMDYATGPDLSQLKGFKITRGSP